MMFSKRARPVEVHDPEVPAPIRLSVLDPPCRCREPLWSEQIQGRKEIPLDLRETPFELQIGPVLQAGDRLEENERLRVTTRAISWPLMAALQAAGYRFQIIRRVDDDAVFFVWRFLSGELRSRYLDAAVDYIPDWPTDLNWR